MKLFLLLVFILLQIFLHNVEAGLPARPTSSANAPRSEVLHRCQVSAALERSMKRRPSESHNIVLTFPSRVAKAIEKAKLKDDATREEKASVLEKLLVEYTKRDQAHHIAAANKLKQYRSKVTSIWISNVIVVTAATPRFIQEIAQVQNRKPCVLAHEGVSSIKNRTIRATPAQDLRTWGRDRIGVQSFWSRYSKGQGIIVGNIDTGVRVSHETLSQNYGGEWYDTIDPRNSNPVDPTGHATAVMSIMAGQNIGVAPDAKWIACRAGDQEGKMSDGNLLLCAQWMFQRRPHVICNSWGSNVGNRDYFNSAMQAWDYVGIAHVFSIGNDGPHCATARSPGDQERAFSVGNVDRNDAAHASSSRGPNVCEKSRQPQGSLKPEISAPGTDIYAATAYGDNTYDSNTGTSFAAPYVAGAMALMLSYNNGLTFQQLQYIMLQNPLTPPNIAEKDRGCFYSGYLYPNAALGHGILDLAGIDMTIY